ncbi:MAG TPA: CBS domain-containing protein [Devosia sp.]|nr:CBS domain-containing protein [Devosia sp.]
MQIATILPAAQRRLATIADGAPLLEAARRLGSGVDLLAVCSGEGHLVGVLTKTDVVKQIGHCQGAGCMALLLLAMTRDVLSCQCDDKLDVVWAQMRGRGLKNVPVVDAAGHPVGIVNARDMLQALLSASTNEEALMRDYVMGVGYR